MLKIAAIVLIAALSALLLLAATRPDTFRVQREASIQAPPEAIFPLIDDLHRWGVWSPYEKKDPLMKRSFSGSASGEGAVYAWEGNPEVGQGRMEILTSSRPSQIRIQLDFVQPFKTRNLVEFTLVPKGGTTVVTWVMQGPSPYLARLLGLFFSMDRMVGKDFEAGLAKLKAIAEG